MDVLKKIGKALLFPPLGIMIALIPFSAAFLIYSMLILGTENLISYISYAVAAYTLTIWCIKAPKMIKYWKDFKNRNKYILKWQEDVRFRIIFSLYASFIWNAAYAFFQFCLGIRHSSFWFYSMAGYYILLAVMRLFLLGHTRRHDPGEKMRTELLKYRTCGIIFLIMNLSLSVMTFLMVYENRTFNHNEVTTITIAAYTFTTFTFAIINIVKYRKYNSPVFSASKAISLASASVSMLTLTSTMLTTFGEGAENELMRKIFLSLIGTAVSLFIIVMAIYMIIEGSKKAKELKGT